MGKGIDDGGCDRDCDREQGEREGHAARGWLVVGVILLVLVAGFLEVRRQVVDYVGSCMSGFAAPVAQSAERNERR